MLWNILLFPFLPNIPFWLPWKHQKTKDFLMFSGGSKGNVGKKEDLIKTQRIVARNVLHNWNESVNLKVNLHCQSGKKVGSNKFFCGCVSHIYKRLSNHYKNFSTNHYMFFVRLLCKKPQKPQLTQFL